MFRIILVALALQLRFGPMLERPPDLHGLSTCYGPPGFRQGDTMANGEPLDLDAPTVAVDDSLKHLLSRRVLVLTECGTVHKVTVADTGYFDEKCRLFRKGQRRVGGWLQRRYWCVRWAKLDGTPVITDSVTADNTEWLEDESWPVVADFPMWYYARVAACRVDAWGRGDTQKVMLWVLPDD